MSAQGSGGNDFDWAFRALKNGTPVTRLAWPRGRQLASAGWSPQGSLLIVLRAPGEVEISFGPDGHDDDLAAEDWVLASDAVTVPTTFAKPGELQTPTTVASGKLEVPPEVPIQGNAWTHASAEGTAVDAVKASVASIKKGISEITQLLVDQGSALGKCNQCGKPYTSCECLRAGKNLRDVLAGNSEFRKLEVPYVIGAGFDMGLQHFTDCETNGVHPCECRNRWIAERAGYRDYKGPKIVCLCGSTRFGAAFAKANLDETLAGNIVLTVGCMTHSDTELKITPEQKLALDELHKRKIDLSDEVLVLNVMACRFCKKPRIIDGEPEYRRCFGVNFSVPPTCVFEPYIGESTRSEIEYALKLGKPVRYLNPEPLP